jgi:hypothetical protein
VRAADFSGWLSAMAGLSARQRREALEALEAASGEGRDLATEDLALGSAKEHGNRRKDALGTTSHERVESQGCPHCAGREVVGLGPLARAFACDPAWKKDPIGGVIGVHTGPLC